MAIYFSIGNGNRSAVPADSGTHMPNCIKALLLCSLSDKASSVSKSSIRLSVVQHTLVFPTSTAIMTKNYPCLCLCLGFSQITLMLPFLLMILHFSQIGFTDDLTFTLNPPFLCYALLSVG